jgi:hypothetical protein
MIETLVVDAPNLQDGAEVTRFRQEAVLVPKSIQVELASEGPPLRSSPS